uniref:Arrowhead PB n=1 Tax=Bombyx mori TaxID=7091 RepID=G1UCX2_BOMMO|nr:arrowhead PB [Bombyx mori]
MKTEHRTCCACGEPIADRFLLEVGGAAWHTGCLRCCVCAVQLDRHPSCFLRDRQVYCKQDYANDVQGRGRRGVWQAYQPTPHLFVPEQTAIRPYRRYLFHRLFNG